MIALLGGRWRHVRQRAMAAGANLQPHRVIVAAVAAFSAVAGSAVYLGHSGGVKTSAAVEGALLASALGCCLPLFMYHAFGYWIRQRALLALVWLPACFRSTSASWPWGSALGAPANGPRRLRIPRCRCWPLVEASLTIVSVLGNYC